MREWELLPLANSLLILCIIEFLKEFTVNNITINISYVYLSLSPILLLDSKSQYHKESANSGSPEINTFSKALFQISFNS